MKCQNTRRDGRIRTQRLTGRKLAAELFDDPGRPAIEAPDRGHLLSNSELMKKLSSNPRFKPAKKSQSVVAAKTLAQHQLGNGGNVCRFKNSLGQGFRHLSPPERPAVDFPHQGIDQVGAIDARKVVGHGSSARCNTRAHWPYSLIRLLPSLPSRKHVK